MAHSTPDKEQLAEATYRAIGRFISEFSQIEGLMYSYLASAARVDVRFVNAVVTHDYSLLCLAVLKVFTTLVPEHEPEIRSLVSRCRALNDIRIKVVHGDWIPWFKRGTLWHISRQKLEISGQIEMQGLLEAEATNAKQIASELERLLWPIAEPILKVEHERAEREGRLLVGEPNEAIPDPDGWERC